MKTFGADPEFAAAAIAAERVEQKTGFPASVTLAFGAVEASWFDASKVTGDFNYWGITRLPEQGPAKMCWTHEDVTEQQLQTFDSRERATAQKVQDLGGGIARWKMQRFFASYPDLESSFEAFVDFFIHSPHRYVAAWQQYQTDHDPDALLKNICAAGYATDTASESLRLEVEHQQNITSAILLARAQISGESAPDTVLA